MRQVLAPHIPQLDMFALLPHPCVGVELGRIGRQGFQRNKRAAPLRQQRLQLFAPMARCALPDRPQRRATLAAPVTQEEEAFPTGQGRVPAHREQRPLGSKATPDRPLSAGQLPAQARGLAARRRGSDDARRQIKGPFLNNDRRPLLPGRFFFRWGQVWVRQRALAASARWAARVSGFCRVQPQAFNRLRTWALWYETWNARRLTALTRVQVQNSPRNPYQVAPRANNSGTRAFSSAVSFGLAPGRGRADTPAAPSWATRFSPWRTAPFVPPMTSATSWWVQPSRFSSNACHRRCSCLTAVGECLVSIPHGYLFVSGLAINAVICRLSNQWECFWKKVLRYVA
jgi:hypothetical protein